MRGRRGKRNIKTKKAEKELMFSLRKGLNLEMRRLSRISNSNIEFKGDKTENSSRNRVGSFAGVIKNT